MPRASGSRTGAVGRWRTLPRTTGRSSSRRLTRTHTLTGIVQNSEVTYVRVSDGVELFHVENVGAGGQTDYSYIYGGDAAVDILVFHESYVPVDPVVTLKNEDATLPIQQVADPFFNNPA